MQRAEPSSQRCEVDGPVDLLAILDERCIEHLDVDASRTFVLFREAVLDLRAVEGTLAAARAVTVTSQGVAWHVSDPDPDAVIEAFYRELVAATDPNIIPPQ
jgi:hypothetical protein